MASNPIDDIVDITVSAVLAPLPIDYQRKSVLISQGATTLAAGTTAVLASPKDFTSIVSGTLVLSSISWANNLVTCVVSGTLNLPVGQQAFLTLTANVPAAYNGTYLVTATAANTFTYALNSDPGSATTVGSAIPASVSEVQSMVNSFFGMGNQLATTVIELGLGTPAAGVAALTAYLTANPLSYYVYVTPRSWASEPTMLSLSNLYNSATAMTYFTVTCTRQNQATVGPNFVNQKSCLLYAESDADLNLGTVFGAAAVAYHICVANPGSNEQLVPLIFAPLSGVSAGNWTSAERLSFKNNFVNYPDDSSEANLVGTILKGGQLASGIFFNFWYSSDWTVLHLHVALAAYILQQSQNRLNPLLYNQSGINRLQQVAQNVIDSGGTFGVLQPKNLPNNTGVVSATSFAAYTSANPSDYAAGIYRGLGATVIPMNGFTHITFNLTVTDVVGGAA